MAMNELDIQFEIMRAAGLEDDEILRLADLREKVKKGSCDDLTQEFKRMSFLKFLYEEGKLSEGTIKPVGKRRLLGNGRWNY